MKMILVLAAALLTTGLSVSARAEEAPEWKLTKVTVQNGGLSIACEETLEVTQVLGPLNVFNLVPSRYPCLKNSGQMVTVITRQNLDAGKGEIVVAQHLVEDAIDLDKLATKSQYLEFVQEKTSRGLSELYSSSSLFGDSYVYFGRLLSENIYPVSCKRFVTTIAGFRNPVGTRTLECTGKAGDISIEVAFKDKNY